jgi:type I restriction enzyme R subunit
LINVELSHYRLSKIKQQHIKLQINEPEAKLIPGEGLGTAKPNDKKSEFLSQLIGRLNELFIVDQLTEQDMVNYVNTITDKVRENTAVMQQINNNSEEQAILGDFAKAVDDAVLDSSETHQNQMMQLLSDPVRAAGFSKLVFDMLKLAK